MSEFKGTKGKWVINEMDRYSRWINIESDKGKKICEALCGNESHPDRQDAEFNALLISKAPEMLETLKDVYLQMDAVGRRMSDENDSKQGLIGRAAKIKQLIKEATELK